MASINRSSTVPLAHYCLKHIYWFFCQFNLVPKKFYYFSASIWFHGRGATEQRALFSAINSGSKAGFGMFVNHPDYPNKVVWNINNYYIASQTDIPNDRWVHLAGTYHDSQGTVDPA